MPPPVEIDRCAIACCHQNQKLDDDPLHRVSSTRRSADEPPVDPAGVARFAEYALQDDERSPME